MTAPGFSVVIPLYDKRPYIRRTLESALAQDYDRFEVIIVDDSSTDGGPESIDDLLGGKVRLLRQANAGPGPARNRGAQEACFDWIALLDADDLWRPDHLSTLADLVTAFPAADAVASGFRKVSSNAAIDDGPRQQVNGRLIDYFSEAAGREALWTSCVAVRRESFLALGGFGAFVPGEDIELWARLALDHRIAVTEVPTAFYVTGTGGLMERCRDARAGTFALQPIHATLAAALADPRYAPRHGVIRAYRDSLLRQSAWGALYDGNPSHARAFLAELDDRTGSLLPHLLALVPGAITARASRFYTRIKYRAG